MQTSQTSQTPAPDNVPPRKIPSRAKNLPGDVLESGETDRPQDEKVISGGRSLSPKKKKPKKVVEEDEIVFDDAPIIPKETIQEFEKKSGEGGKNFSSMIYNHPNYNRIMGAMKRGERAVNWKTDGYGYAVLYSTRTVSTKRWQRKKWTKKGHGKQKAKEGKTQCVFMTQLCSQCIRLFPIRPWRTLLYTTPQGIHYDIKTKKGSKDKKK